MRILTVGRFVVTVWWWTTADQTTWNQKVTALIDGLPDDTLLTVVDCHI